MVCLLKNFGPWAGLGWAKPSPFGPLIYSTGIRSRPYGVIINDFNKDNQLDLIVVTVATNKVILLEGYGNETFFVLGYNFDPYSVAVTDLTENTWLDIVVTNYGSDEIEIL
jgi:hypothetical protein